MTMGRGVARTGSVLDRIVADARERLDQRRHATPEAALRARFADYDAQWPLRRAIVEGRPGAVAAKVVIVAEIKKASPSRGLLAPDLDHLAVARQYAKGGAVAISVLTEERHFHGSLDWLRDVRLDLSAALPVDRPALLRKDFLTDPYELVEARAFGADTVLLIVALLEQPLLRDLLQQAVALDLDALVEVHDEPEAERAVAAGASLFGINNRDLHSFEVDLATTERLRPLLPTDAVVIGESGVHRRADVERLYKAGVSAILVGEAFMTAPDIPAKLAELSPHLGEESRP